MEIHLVDPRDTTSQVDQPNYRVYVWRRGEGGGLSAEEFRLLGAQDVSEVLAFAGSHQADSVAVYVESATSDGLTLLKLHSSDPFNLS